ncbi:MAG: DnaJ domain-containing protein, partial [Anaerolineales bacterium]
DLYSLLGVPRTATADEIKAAYRNAARRFHPDANSNPGASEEFKQIAEAYAVLGDPARRSNYDANFGRVKTGPLFESHFIFSREVLPQIAESQVLYVLAEVLPGFHAELPDPPLNLCIAIDRSTSMQGARLDQVKAAVLQVVDSLRENDSFSVVTFSDKAEVVVPAQTGPADRMLAKAKVSTLSAHGGTEILQGLMGGLTELHQHLSPTAVNHLILLTDGRTYGDEDDCLMLAGLAATDGITVSGLGIGEEWNDKFLDELTGRTGGTATYISSPQQVKSFIQDRVRGLGNAYAERLSLQVTLDANMTLQSAFKISPEVGPVPVDEQPLRLGSLPKHQLVSILLKFQVPPLAEGVQPIARLAFVGDVVCLGRSGERVITDLALPVVKNPPPAAPPTAMLDALSRLSQYKMQERAWQEADSGDIISAAQRLQTLSTRLLAGGQTDLAKVALAEARRLENTHILSEEAKKHLKYGTRALLLAPGTGRKL